MILKQVHDTNMRAKGYPERVFSVSDSNSTILGGGLIVQTAVQEL